MPNSAARAAHETTPLARLEEGELGGVIGYQVAQAAVATVATFLRAGGETAQLRPVEFTILVLVKNNPGVTASRLARALAVSAPNITAWLNRLQKRGFVHRELDSRDKRHQRLRVTPAGGAAADTAIARVVETERQAWPNLSVGERAILVELLHKIARRR
jgi:DNA-binding MarR family transcriptional regulator